MKWYHELNRQLEEWRTTLPQQHKWSDSDPSARDIQAAHLRAKYYGAQYLLHRPFLHCVLHPTLHHDGRPVIPSRPFNAISPTDALRPANAMNPSFSNRVSSGPVNMQHPHFLIEAKICVQAAVQSTIAFAGVSKTPIVISVFGSAHTYVYLVVLSLFACAPTRNTGNLATCSSSPQLIMPDSRNWFRKQLSVFF